MNQYEKHAQEYLQYVAEHEEVLKKAVRKNITYDERLFDDVFQDTILKIYDYITKKERIIKDFKGFHFICNKNNYILADSKSRKEDKMLARTFFDNLDRPVDKMETYDDIKCYANYTEEQKLFADDYDSVQKAEERIEKINLLIEFTKEELEKQFDDFEVGLFLIYYKLKADKEKISYKKLAEITGLELKTVTNIISKMKKTIRSNTEIMNKKKELLNNEYN